MSDLVVGYAVIGALSAGLFLSTAHAARRHGPRVLDLAALVAVIALFAYIRWLWYDPRLAQWLPYSNLIVVGNWLPLFSAALAGLVWSRMASAPLRRTLVAGALGLSGTLAAIYPLLGHTPACGNRWDKLGTCLQTTNYTCSPACAATLLKKHGIAASEQEMAELCLTHRGTSWQGLYRGLKLKTAGSQWDVEVCQGPVELVARHCGDPMILSVGLAAGAPNPELTREFGWVPGVNHSVVLETVRSGGIVVIADPSQEMARENWDHRMLATLWRGTALRLVPRER
ncbi:MAG: cysteine peptidase family C39 domain-containing protein [Planctomycetaceae bacterium]|nr:cysteine peptidase family C39 domain-containing protein [Planctomycetaceae bacterium]